MFLIGMQINGQGYVMVYSQVVVEKFGVSIEDIDVIQGDMDWVLNGGGIGGFWFILFGLLLVWDVSVVLVKKVKEIVVDWLEVGVEDLEFESGFVWVVGIDQQVMLVEIVVVVGEMLLVCEEVK